MANPIKRAAYAYRGMGADQMIGTAMGDGELVARIVGMLGVEHPFAQGLLMAVEGQRRVDAAPKASALAAPVAPAAPALAAPAAPALAAPALASPAAPALAAPAAAAAAAPAPATGDIDAKIAAALDPLRASIDAILAHLAAPKRSRKVATA